MDSLNVKNKNDATALCHWWSRKSSSETDLVLQTPWGSGAPLDLHSKTAQVRTGTDPVEGECGCWSEADLGSDHSSSIDCVTLDTVLKPSAPTSTGGDEAQDRCEHEAIVRPCWEILHPCPPPGTRWTDASDVSTRITSPGYNCLHLWVVYNNDKFRLEGNDEIILGNTRHSLKNKPWWISVTSEIADRVIWSQNENTQSLILYVMWPESQCTVFMCT